jgi:hypothetical protein
MVVAQGSTQHKTVLLLATAAGFSLYFGNISVVGLALLSGMTCSALKAFRSSYVHINISGHGLLLHAV